LTFGFFYYTDVNMGKIIKNPWAYPGEELVQELCVSQDTGLATQEAKRRLKQYGPNRLRETKRKSPWKILFEQFKGLIAALLVVAALVSFFFGDFIEGIAIVVVIMINATIGFFTELKAVRSMEGLRRLGSVSVRVRRDSEIQEIPAEGLIPGDIVVLEGGDIVNADIRLLTSSKFQTDESALTGESLPVSKSIETLDIDTPLAERANMLYKGTAVTRGSCEGIVITTGMETELGQISSLVEEAEEEITPLEKRLNQLGHKLIVATLIIAAFVATAGILVGKGAFLMIETSIALAVAAIPEGLPIVATIALARGMLRMARRNALISQLSAVETLGATNVIFTDKTGTLTENRMTVTLIALDSGDIEVSGDSVVSEEAFTRNDERVAPLKNKILRKALEISILCNNASLQSEELNEENKVVGDPMEGALLIAGVKTGLYREELTRNLPEVREEAFDSDVKMMATFHKDNDRYLVAVKGAPEYVLNSSSHILTEEGEREMSDEKRKEWLNKNNQMAEKGLRVVAIATKIADSIDSEPYKHLTLLALIGLEDPPREDVRKAIELCQDAGIKVVMVTGDQAITASNIGYDVGLADKKEIEVIHGKDLKNPDELSEEEKQKILQVPIFARVNPRQKLNLIDLYQKNGAIVAMTGDGVNDAPALKEADIGIAMGQRGTEVAREAADMVLKDDAFPTIVAAIEQGRVIFNNIRKFVLYLISCNVSEIMVVTSATIVNLPLPILPLQILFLNLVSDVFPALALGVGEGDRNVMKQPPRNPGEPILARRHWLDIGGYGFLMTISVFGALILALKWLGMGERQAVSVSFLTLAFTQLWHVFNMRDKGSNFLRNSITRNPFIWGALFICIGLLLVALYVPVLSDVLKLVNPGMKGWIIVITMSLIPLVIGQFIKARGSREFQ
jgi:Ca2+-transporting ATPase